MRSLGYYHRCKYLCLVAQLWIVYAQQKGAEDSCSINSLPDLSCQIGGKEERRGLHCLIGRRRTGVCGARCLIAAVGSLSFQDL